MKKMLLLVLLLAAVPRVSGAVIKANDDAPAFSLPDRGNKEFALNRAVGTKAGKNHGVILSFFASWCLPCRQELPLLNAAADELNAKGITIVLVGVRESFDSINRLLTELKVDKPVVVSDRDGRVTGMYQVRVLPVTFFIGADGKVKDVIYGGISDAARFQKSAVKLMP